MDAREEQLRKEIEERVKEIHKIRNSGESFVPGKSKVNDAGRVYDEKEIIALVNSSIDFWLTLGEKGRERFSNFVLDTPQEDDITMIIAKRVEEGHTKRTPIKLVINSVKKKDKRNKWSWNDNDDENPE